MDDIAINETKEVDILDKILFDFSNDKTVHGN